MHYYQHHIGDFIKATARLSDSQAMAYLRIMWLYYDKDGLVEHDLEQIAFEVGSDVKTVGLIIKTYFTIDGEYIKQTRCDKEIQGYLNKSTGGKKGAESRWSNKDSHSLPNGIAIANPMPTQCEPNANQEPITNNHIKNKSIAPPSGVDPNVFKDFVTLRRSKKAPVTATAIKGFEKEAAKAGLTLQGAMELCCSRGWAGFKAEWLADKNQTKQDQANEAFHQLTGGMLKAKPVRNDAVFQSIAHTIDMEQDNARIL